MSVQERLVKMGNQQTLVFLETMITCKHQMSILGTMEMQVVLEQESQQNCPPIL